MPACCQHNIHDRWGLLQVLGSIYIPEVNYIMMVLTVVVVAVFKTTVQLGNAYGNAANSS